MWLCRLNRAGWCDASLYLRPTSLTTWITFYHNIPKSTFMIPGQFALPIFTSTDHLAIRRLSHKRFKNVRTAPQGRAVNHSLAHSGWGVGTVTQGRSQKRWMSTESSLYKSQSDSGVLPGTMALSGKENSAFQNVPTT